MPVIEAGIVDRINRIYKTHYPVNHVNPVDVKLVPKVTSLLPERSVTIVVPISRQIRLEETLP